VSGKVSLKVKLKDFLELTLQRKLLKRTLTLKLRARGYPDNLSEKILSEVKFSERSWALHNKQKTHKIILPFIIALPCLILRIF